MTRVAVGANVTAQPMLESMKPPSLDFWIVNVASKQLKHVSFSPPPGVGSTLDNSCWQLRRKPALPGSTGNRPWEPNSFQPNHPTELQLVPHPPFTVVLLWHHHSRIKCGTRGTVVTGPDRPGNWRWARLLLLVRISECTLEKKKKKKRYLLLFKSHYRWMLWWEPVRNIALGKVSVYAIEHTGWGAGVEWVFLSVELGEEAAWDIFISVVLTQPDSPSEKLMRRNGLVEEPTGRIYTCHRHLNPGLLNLQLRPCSLPLPLCGWEMTCLRWPDTLSVWEPERSSSVCGAPLPPLNSVGTGRRVLL